MTVYHLVFCDSVITPVVKNMSHPLHNVNNYHPVSIISIVAKIFECIVNICFCCMFISHDNQFGFTVNGKFNKAIFALNSIVRFYQEKLSNVYACALDVIKAFNCLN